MTGDDCLVQGDGTIKITNPRLGNAGNVAVAGTMVLAANRSQLFSETPVPFGLRVGAQTVLAGPITVKDVRFCDLAPPNSGPPAGLPFAPFSFLEEEDGGLSLSGVRLPAEVNCRLLPGVEFNSPTVSAGLKLLGLDVVGENGPVSFLVDNARGGRVAGVLPITLPPPISAPQAVGNSKARIGVLLEFSADNGLALIGLSGRYPKGFTIPGTDIGFKSLRFSIVPAENRFGGGASLTLGGFRALGDVEIKDQRLSRLGAVIALPSPGIAVFPPSLFVNAVGASFQGGETVKGPGGVRTEIPTTVTGTVGFGFTDPTGRLGVGGPVNVTFGDGFRMDGSYCLITPVKPCTAALGQARILVRRDPFRFEAQNTVNVLSGLLVGSVFAGATLQPFHVTLLGNLTAKVPNKVPFVGGSTLGSLSAAVSDRGAGAVTRISNPFGEDPTVGFAAIWSPFDIKVISSLSSVITVSATQAERGVQAQAAREHATRLRLKGGLGNLMVVVTGRRRAPTGAALRSTGGRLQVHRVPGANGRSVAFIVRNAPAGVLSATGPGIAKVEASRIGRYPYLDPSPGYGTRERPPVTAGTPVQVCWDVRQAGPGLTVELLEDQNGQLGTGRTIADGQPAKGCFAVPTAGLEPGRHWVYGIVKRPDGVALSARYWPIGITITDPAALPVPGNAKVAPTADGARVSFDPVAGAGAYLIRAEPTEEGAVPPVEVQVPDGSGTEVSLRGARSWRVTVQAEDPDGRPGNLSEAVEVTPSAGVVVSGTPTGLAEIGRLWAFKLETANVARLRLVSGPPGTRLAQDGLVRWTPGAAASKDGFVTFSVEGCSTDNRCVTREFEVTAFTRGRVPLGPIRGFDVLESAARPGQQITLLVQGARGTSQVRIDGRVVKSRIVDSGTVVATLPARLGKGSHDVSLRLGGNAVEQAPQAITVL
ncbi:MAG: hypothetical protein MUE51_03710 [Thermoleophilia bacterium]|nr:hypothetical protein [Thermoleophilia bacterium]